VSGGVNGGKKSGFTCSWNLLLFSQGTILQGTNAIPQVNDSTIGSSNSSYPDPSSHSRFLKKYSTDNGSPCESSLAWGSKFQTTPYGFLVLLVPGPAQATLFQYVVVEALCVSVSIS